MNWRRAAIVMMVLPLIGIGVVLTLAYYKFGYFITIENRSPGTVEIALIDPLFVPEPKELTFGHVTPGAAVTRRFQFEGEGSVTYIVRFADKPEQSGMLIGYVTGGAGGKATLTIAPDGSVTAKEEFDTK